MSKNIKKEVELIEEDVDEIIDIQPEPEKVKVRYLTLAVGPEKTIYPGDTVDVSKEEAEYLREKRFAELVEEGS